MDEKKLMKKSEKELGKKMKKLDNALSRQKTPLLK